MLQDLQGAGRSSAGRSLRLAGRFLVVAQLTLTVVLLACAGWMIGGVYMLLHQPLGFEPDHLLMLKAQFGSGELDKADSELAEKKLTEMAASLRQLPGVVSVAFTDHQPLGHAINRYDFCSDQHPEECKQQVHINPNSYAISPGYFSTIGQPVIGASFLMMPMTDAVRLQSSTARWRSANGRGRARWGIGCTPEKFIFPRQRVGPRWLEWWVMSTTTIWHRNRARPIHPAGGRSEWLCAICNQRERRSGIAQECGADEA